jgi:Tol biopolymer transport system component
MLRKSGLLLSISFLVPCFVPCLHGEVTPQPPADRPAEAPTPQIFAPGIISGPANDGSPAFMPDGNTLFFTRSATHWTVILESQKIDGQWTKPTLAPFSGEWPDSSPAVSPDGSYIVFQSTRPAVAPSKPGEPVQRAVSNLWRVDRVGTGWSEPKRLPDTVNIGHSIWKPSIAADDTLYLTVIDEKGGKRLFSSQYKDGAYQRAQPLSFSDGTTSDVDPEVAPDQSFLVFCSSGRPPSDGKDHLYIVRKNGADWGPVAQIRYAGDDNPYGYSTDDEPHLGPDHRTLYFSSDRAIPVHFPRTREHAREDLERLDSWDNSNSNVWSIPLSPSL